MFYAAIFRPLTFARNRATMASRKRKTRRQRERENMIKARGGKNGTLQAGQRKARFRRAFSSPQNSLLSNASVGALQVCFVAFLGGRKDVRPPRSSQTRGICVCSSHNTKTMGDHCFEKCVVRPLPKKFCDTFWEPCSVC